MNKYMLFLMICFSTNCFAQNSFFLITGGTIGMSKHEFKTSSANHYKMGGSYHLSLGKSFGSVATSIGLGYLSTGSDLDVTNLSVGHLIIPIEATFTPNQKGITPFFKLSLIPSNVIDVDYDNLPSDFSKAYESNMNQWNFNTGGTVGISFPLSQGKINLGFNYLRSVTSIQKGVKDHPTLLGLSLTFIR